MLNLLHTLEYLHQLGLLVRSHSSKDSPSENQLYQGEKNELAESERGGKTKN